MSSPKAVQALCALNTLFANATVFGKEFHRLLTLLLFVSNTVVTIFNSIILFSIYCFPKHSEFFVIISSSGSYRVLSRWFRRIQVCSELWHALFVQLYHFRNEQFVFKMWLPVHHCRLKETTYFYSSVTVSVFEAALTELHASTLVLNWHI